MTAAELVKHLGARFGQGVLGEQLTKDSFPTVWIRPEIAPAVHRFLKSEIAKPFSLLADLWAIDETARRHREGQPPSGVTIASHLVSLDRNLDICLKVPLDAQQPRAHSIAHVYPNADWYEREAYDLFGVQFEGRKDHRRILLPPLWEGHPLRKDQPVRATERPPFVMTQAQFDAEERALAVDPQALDLPTERDGLERRPEREVRERDLHPTLHAHRLERDEERVRSVRAGDAMRNADIVCQFVFQGRNAFPLNEIMSLENGRDARVDLLFQRAILRAKVAELHGITPLYRSAVLNAYVI